jgi:hypothetical protein
MESKLREISDRRNQRKTKTRRGRFSKQDKCNNTTMTRGREGERKECCSEVGVINSEQEGKTQLPGEDKGKCEMRVIPGARRHSREHGRS